MNDLPEFYLHVVLNSPFPGNLLNQTLGLLQKNCQSTLGAGSAVDAEGTAFKETVKTLVKRGRIHYENLSLSEACEAVPEIGRAGNFYVDERAPWSLFKQGGPASEAAAKTNTKWGGFKRGQVKAQLEPVFARIETQVDEEGRGAVSPRSGKKKVKEASLSS